MFYRLVNFSVYKNQKYFQSKPLNKQHYAQNSKMVINNPKTKFVDYTKYRIVQIYYIVITLFLVPGMTNGPSAKHLKQN